MEVGDRDLLNPNVMRDNMHDWVLANEKMAKVLAAKGYHYQFVFARNAGHTDRAVKQQTLPEALEYRVAGVPMNTSRDIRRTDRALTTDEAREILARAEHGVLATVGEDGWPYAVPLNHVLAGDLLYLHCAGEGHKLENISHEERVSFCAVASAAVLPARLSTLYESAIAFGRASLVTDPEEKRRALEALAVRLLWGAVARGGESHRRIRPANRRGAHPSRTNHREGPPFRLSVRRPHFPLSRRLRPGGRRFPDRRERANRAPSSVKAWLRST